MLVNSVLLLLFIYLHKTSQMPAPAGEEMERVLEITSQDRLNIKLAEAVGVSHLAVSYPEVNIAVKISFQAS